MTDQIIYTITDESPALATRSFLPIIKAFTKSSGINIVASDISLAARIISSFPERLSKEQQLPDALSELGQKVQEKDANIIKLPNISASLPQLLAAIKELQDQGYAVPDYPAEPKNEEEKEIRARYDKVKGSAVNPVLREGNSDRRAPKAVKNYARKHPHSMGAWSHDSKTNVATMTEGDFYGNEVSTTVKDACKVNIELHAYDGTVTSFRELNLQPFEVIDATVMSSRALTAFLKKQMRRAKQENILFSLHLKATMMKVSDPVMFGYAEKAYFAPVFEKYGAELEALGINANNGLGSLMARLDELEPKTRDALKQAITDSYAQNPDLAMVDSDKGITNLHVPSDVIIDASMPAMIRAGGKMWDKNGEMRDTLAVIPDRTYAGVYQTVIDFCREHGALNPAELGSVANVGLMAQKAEEYGSHNKTFIIDKNGVVVVKKEDGTILMRHKVEKGDIWRMCRAKDPAIKDWVQLAVRRARASNTPMIFWLDPKRAHDREIERKVEKYLAECDTSGLDISILSPEDATLESLRLITAGKDVISVTGNVMRDYLTDLFPILEVGTSAKMLSIVPLLAGGGLYETGAGGSAPKHTRIFLDKNRLNWDSLGEFLALTVSLEQFAENAGNARAQILADTLDKAVEQMLNNGKSPQKTVGTPDNRTEQFYIAMYWAQALALQSKDAALAAEFKPIAEKLSNVESQVIEEMMKVQGQSIDIGGYYHPNDAKADAAMRPSATFNAIIDAI
ncbi:MAG: NADP-dependent isocitrate dehydrogenase [Cardiobacteriaceae bacterium]|nr:NADP-dependent isocitrate dehydrogenase [Cardiobacteriaceae bacterium]